MAIKHNLQQLRSYKRQWIKDDCVAGVMVAAITIPVCMGYAQIAGLPPVYGLYAAIIPAIIYVIFASSRRVMFGTDAVIASMIGAGLAGVSADPARLPALAALSALLIGVLLFLFGMLRVGAIARYLSKPTMTGFIAGLAVIVMVSQLPKLLGLTISGEDTLTILATIAAQLSAVHWHEFAIGGFAIVLLLIARRYAARFPSALLLLIIATAISAFFGWHNYDIAVVGTVPAGIAEPIIPWVSWQDITYMISVCFATAVVVFADTLLTARNFALNNKDSLNDNQELRAIGIANIAGGFLGALPGAASASRSAVAESSGMRTQVAQCVSAITIALVLVFFNKVLYHMPVAVLAAIVVVAVTDLFAIRLFKKLYSTRPREFWLTVTTALAVIILGILPGVLISVALSLGDFFLRSAHPPQALLGKIRHKKGFYDMHESDNISALPGITIYRFGAPLFFANHEEFERELLKIARDKDIYAIIIDASAITDIDTTAADPVRATIERITAKGVHVYFAGAIQSVRNQLSVYSIRALPHVHVHKTIDGAVAASKINAA